LGKPAKNSSIDETVKFISTGPNSESVADIEVRKMKKIDESENHQNLSEIVKETDNFKKADSS
jgi:hypothetical protein